MGESVCDEIRTHHAKGGEQTSVPDLIDDDKVLAVALMQQPIRLMQSQRERVERGFAGRRRCLFYLWALFFGKFVEI